MKNKLYCIYYLDDCVYKIPYIGSFTTCLRLYRSKSSKYDIAPYSDILAFTRYEIDANPAITVDYSFMRGGFDE